jgi:hypothetical protein
MVRGSGMFGLLRYNGKANGKEPKRQNERTLEHGPLKAKSQQTPVKSLHVSARHWLSISSSSRAERSGVEGARDIAI